MARTRTAGIKIDSDGRRIIDKEHRGVGIYLRLGPISQEDAEQQLANEVARIDAELRNNTNHRHRFVDCAERYPAESKHRRSVDVAAWHVRLLTPYIGMHIAWSIIEAQRGQHPIWVFPYQGERVSTMNNTAWQRARSEVSLAGVRIHD